jgi:hypothetical protein
MADPSNNVQLERVEAETKRQASVTDGIDKRLAAAELAVKDVGLSVNGVEARLT